MEKFLTAVVLMSGLVCNAEISNININTINIKDHSSTVNSGISGLETGKTIEGNGKLTRIEQPLSVQIEKIETGNGLDVHIHCGAKTSKLEFQADSNILPAIKTEIKGNTLMLSLSGSLTTKNPISATIFLPTVKEVKSNQAGKMSITGLDNDAFTLISDGTGEIAISGSTKILNVTLNGACILNAQQLNAQTVQITARDATEATVNASKELKVEITDAAAVNCYGKPQKITKQLDDAATLNMR
ncbi:MAG: DUF2807 domain-containing protein [Victivallaceae bacterium]